MLRQCADLYAQLIKVNINPRQADDLELWQIAALMETTDQPSNRPGEFSSKPTSTGEALIAARVAAAREGREIDSRDMVTGISEEDMTAFLEQKIAGG